MDELFNLLNVVPSKEHDGKIFIDLACKVGYEPFGEQSEKWEHYWTLRLPQIEKHWLSEHGWRKANTDGGIVFYGATAEEVVGRAVDFLRWYKVFGELAR